MNENVHARSLSTRVAPGALPLGFCACALVLLTLSCSQNQYYEKGPAPPAPKNPRIAHVVQNSGAPGMNQVAMPDQDQASGGQEPSQEASGGQQPSQEAAGGSFTGKVVIPAALEKHFKPGETLFIILRASDGSPTPVAAQKLTVRSFPLAFTITDRDAMMGGALPPKGDILLRLDADGDLATQGPDDLVGGPVPAKAGTPVTLDLQEPPK